MGFIPFFANDRFQPYVIATVTIRYLLKTLKNQQKINHSIAFFSFVHSDRAPNSRLNINFSFVYHSLVQNCTYSDRAPFRIQIRTIQIQIQTVELLRINLVKPPTVEFEFRISIQKEKDISGVRTIGHEINIAILTSALSCEAHANLILNE